MPIHCPIDFPRLTTDEMRDLDYQVMAHAFAAQNELGRLCDESVYQANLANRLNAAGISARIEFPITLAFREFSKTLSVDLVVDHRVPYELKAVAQLTDEHENQLLCYLLLTNARRGKLLNFRSDSVDSKFVNAPLETADRHQFTVDTTDWSGDAAFEELVTELISDWGTSLDQSLYLQAMTECLGGKDRVIQQLPMQSANGPMGNQRFYLVDAHTAFRVTTFADGVQANQVKHLQKLIRPSPVDRLYWVNIARHQLRFQTIHRKS